MPHSLGYFTDMVRGFKNHPCVLWPSGNSLTTTTGLEKCRRDLKFNIFFLRRHEGCFEGAIKGTTL